MAIKPGIPSVACARRKDVPPTVVLPPDVKTLRCVSCEAKVVAAPSTARHVADGLMQPVCYRCLPPDGPNEITLPVMTTEQARDLERMDAAPEAN
jgi:hypothetical protein